MLFSDLWIWIRGKFFSQIPDLESWISNPGSRILNSGLDLRLFRLPGYGIAVGVKSFYPDLHSTENLDPDLTHCV
jgi:hypothetical protein